MAPLPADASALATAATEPPALADGGDDDNNNNRGNGSGDNVGNGNGNGSGGSENGPGRGGDLTEEEREHPLVKALPPETDFLTYLTVVEYNLDGSPATLDLLHKLLLRDERLTTNIGWDLVQLLLPLLPASKPCLDVVARLGNPREVVIKVTEMLEGLGRSAGDVSSDADQEHSETVSSSPLSSHEPPETVDLSLGPVPTESIGAAHIAKTKDTELTPANTGLSTSDEGAAGNDTGRQGPTKNHVGPDTTERPHNYDKALKYQQLLKMLGILHPRIKTKRPSRFLITALESVLYAYRSLGTQIILGDVTDVTIDLIKDLSSITRPPLPPRTSSNKVPLVALPDILAPGDDPEAELVDHGETASQLAILVSFATQIFETYVVKSRMAFPVDSVTWTTEYMERQFPGRLPLNETKLSQPLLELLARIRQTEDQILSVLASRLGVRGSRLGSLLPSKLDRGSVFNASDLPASRQGALMLLARLEYGRIKTEDGPAQFSRGDHRQVVEYFLGTSESFDLGPESLGVVDAVLLLGWVWMPQAGDHTAAKAKQVTGGGDGIQEEYNRYLQQLSFVSAHAPSPVLRYQVHYLVTKLLRSTPQAQLRLGYIQDTLEFCPFQNLRVTAIGWIKDEILAAFDHVRNAAGADDDGADLFRQPETLYSVGQSIFEPPGASTDITNAETAATNLPFWLAALNFLYLISASDEIRSALDVKQMAEDLDVSSTFVGRIEVLSQQLQGSSDQLEEMSDFFLLADAVSRAKKGLRLLSTT